MAGDGSEYIKHMDVGSRNARLCAKLQDMGLFVIPSFSADEPGTIDHMIVSVELPSFVRQPSGETNASPPDLPAATERGPVVRLVSTSAKPYHDREI